MIFRVTISCKNSNSSVAETPVNSFGSIKKDFLSKANIKVPSVNDDVIILTSEEITNIDISFLEYGTGNANSEPTANVNIQGILMGKIKNQENNENDILNNPLGINTLIDEVTSKKIKSLEKPLQILGDSFKNSLASKVNNIVSQFGKSKLTEFDFYDINFNNTKELAKWALSYGSENDYRDVVIEMMLSEYTTKKYVLPDMYAVYYNENASQFGGNNSFSISLKQERFSDRKIQIL